MDWQPAPDALIELIEEHLDLTVVEARYAPLSFYRDGHLVEAECLDETVRLVFGGVIGLAFMPLTGSVEQIIAANEIGGLELNRDNIADYTRFFCNHLHGAHGPFQMVDDAAGLRLATGHKLRNTKTKVRSQESDGAFRVGGFQLFADQLFRVSLRVGLDGSVQMLRGISLGEIVTAH